MFLMALLTEVLVLPETLSQAHPEMVLPVVWAHLKGLIDKINL